VVRWIIRLWIKIIRTKSYVNIPMNIKYNEELIRASVLLSQNVYMKKIMFKQCKKYVDRNIWCFGDMIVQEIIGKMNDCWNIWLFKLQVIFFFSYLTYTCVQQLNFCKLDDDAYVLCGLEQNFSTSTTWHDFPSLIRLYTDDTYTVY